MDSNLHMDRSDDNSRAVLGTVNWMPDPGLYVNLFEVRFDDRGVEVMCTQRDLHPDLRPLRRQISEKRIDTRVYATGGEIYGYGPQRDRLSDFGFTIRTVQVGQLPQLASRLILDGYVSSLEEAGYTCAFRLGRATVHQFAKALLETPVGVKLFWGVELQSIFLLDPQLNELAYFMVVNPVFTYRSPDNRPLNMHDIVTQYGNDTLRILRTSSLSESGIKPFDR